MKYCHTFGSLRITTNVCMYAQSTTSRACEESAQRTRARHVRNMQAIGHISHSVSPVRSEIIGHFQPCMTEIYLHIDARMADYIRTHP